MTEEWVNRSSLRRGYVHGFKSRARSTATEVRRQSGHGETERLDTDGLLAHLDLRKINLSELAGINDEAWNAVVRLTMVDESAFSGALIPGSGGGAVLLNDRHSEERVRATTAHEIGHSLLKHSDTPLLAGSQVRARHAQVEREADFLGMCLLVPEPVVVRAAKRDFSRDAADRRQLVRELAVAMGVSFEMMQWAFNMSGAWRRAEASLGTSAGRSR